MLEESTVMSLVDYLEEKPELDAPNYCVVDIRYLIYLLHNKDILEVLEEHGVANWEGYTEALAEL